MVGVVLCVVGILAVVAFVVEVVVVILCIVGRMIDVSFVFGNSKNK
jgi:hypothetical protein